jgi:hypothetical protein
MVGGDTKQRKVPTTIELGRNSHILNAESVTEIPLRVFFFIFYLFSRLNKYLLKDGSCIPSSIVLLCSVFEKFIFQFSLHSMSKIHRLHSSTHTEMKKKIDIYHDLQTNC